MSRKDPGGAPGSVDDDDDDDDDDDSGGSGGGLNAVCETKYPDLIAETTVDETDTDGDGNEATFGALIGGVTIDVPPDIGESCMSVEMKIQPFFFVGDQGGGQHRRFLLSMRSRSNPNHKFDNLHQR